MMSGKFSIRVPSYYTRISEIRETTDKEEMVRLQLSGEWIVLEAVPSGDDVLFAMAKVGASRPLVE